MKLYRRHIATDTVDNAADYPNGIPFEAGDGYEWVPGDPGERETHTPLPFQEQVRQAFEQLPLELQKKYKREILEAAFFLERGNIPMVLDSIEEVKAKMTPGETAVKDIVDGAEVHLTRLQQGGPD